jgi:hypothetical protein
MDLKEMKYGGLDWIHLAEDIVQWAVFSCSIRKGMP